MRALTIASLVAAAFLPISSHAQAPGPSAAAKAKWLTIPEVHARLESAGYRNIEKIERESGSYEIKATDQAGQRIRLYVHPQTGEVIDPRMRDQYASGYAKGNQRSAADCNQRRCRDDLPQQGAAQPAAGK